MCGIQIDGENHFRIAPQPGGYFTYAKTTYASVYGKVESGWEETEDGMKYTIRIPSNCTAIILLPDGSKQIQNAGEKSYIIERIEG